MASNSPAKQPLEGPALVGVAAKSAGYYDVFRAPGDKFTIRDETGFSKRWMRRMTGHELAAFFGLSREHISVDFLWTQVLTDREILALVGLFEMQPGTQSSH